MGTQNRILVLSKPGESGPPAAAALDFPTMLEARSNRLPTMGQVKRLHGPLALRQLLGVSALKMRDALQAVGLKVQQHQTIYTWERAERDPRNLPRNYWRRWYMTDQAVAAYHLIIGLFVEWLSNGIWRARVSGKRIWHVQLRRVA